MISFFTKYNSNYKFLTIQSILLFLLLNTFLSDFYCRKDLSRENRFNLTESTEQTLKSLPENLFIDAYFSSDIPGEHKARIGLTKELIKEIASRNKAKVQLRFYDPDSSEFIKRKAEEAGIKAVTLEKQEIGSASIKQAFFGLKLTVGSKSAVIPVAYMAESIEYQILTTLKKSLSKNASSGVAILKTKGVFNAPDPQQTNGYGLGKDTFGVFIHMAFAQENGTVPEVNINEEPITEDTKTIFIVGAPELTEKGKYYLDQFLMRGGNIVYFAKMFEFQMGGGRNSMMMGGGQEGLAQPDPQAEALNSFFSNYGFEIRKDMILEPEESYAVIDIFQQLQGRASEAMHYPLWVMARKDSRMIHPSSLFTKNTQALLLPWSSSIEVKTEKQPSVQFTTLVESTTNADKRSDFILVSEDKVAKQTLNPQNTKFPLAIHLEGSFKSSFKKETIPKEVTEVFLDKTRENKKSQILVFGTPYLLSDMLVMNDSYSNLYRKYNMTFMLNLFDILNGDTELLASRSKQSYTKNLKNVTKTEKFIYSFINILFLPIGVGIYAFFRLKKRNASRGVA
jgi:ABC-type uncharacterized transport system involved in gliding motility auxiliary subunit